MFPFGAWKAVLFGLGLFVGSSAHSTQRNPLTSATRVHDAVIQTPSHRVHALSSFELVFSLFDHGQRVRLVLEPNHDIISDDATITYLAADGSAHLVEPVDRAEHRIFRGHAFIQRESGSEWNSAGWARINVHRDGANPIFEGAFRVHGDHHHIQTSHHFRQTRIQGDPHMEMEEDDYMIVWRDSDVTRHDSDAHGDLKRDPGSAAACSSDELRFNRDENNMVYRRNVHEAAVEENSLWSTSPKFLFARQSDQTGGNSAGVNLADSIGSTAGCPTTRKVALIGVATDCTYTANFDSAASVRANIIQQVNTASQLYESTFNISLGIQNLTISDASCPSTAAASAPWNIGCSGNTDITNRLSLFSQWRGQWSDTNAYWTLLTTCNTDSAVGLAWLGQVCQSGSNSQGNGETTASANVVVRTSSEWQVFAHETAHTFGAVHDCLASTCSDGTSTRQQCCPLSRSTCDANGQFLMNPSTGSDITNFSPCSIGNVCSFLGRNSATVTCLTNNKNVTTITGSQCGNGIVESGEDCDCGGASGCGNNPCCDAATCRFTRNSICDPSNEECCSDSCQFRNNGTVCRASTGVCDVAEVCPGNSGACPADITTPDGESCGDGRRCASGQCTSRDMQCQTLMGSMTSSNDTRSCDNSGCMLSCSSPDLGSSDTCWTMQQNFLDGTPCDGGGLCRNGNCEGASLAQSVLQWIRDNENIFIPVAVVGGLIILALLYSLVRCIWARFGKRGGSPPKEIMMNQQPTVSSLGSRVYRYA